MWNIYVSYFPFVYEFITTSTSRLNLVFKDQPFFKPSNSSVFWICRPCVSFELGSSHMLKYAFELAVDLWDRQVIYWLVYVILDTLEFFNKIWQHLWLHFVAIKATENMLRTRTENKNKIYKVMVEFCFLWPKSYLLYESFKAKLFSIMPKQLK